ncbi:MULTISPECIES: heavy metal translocating P-type ATPase [Campylobacter]|uniref:heavy metal translocating P-type ATPase n=1 Tax=Campylobacter TaxID=194 RepID=UPI0014738D3A|nr:heavy metal translocating P-type ATPase [Campylobacter sp. RM12916]MBE3022746.1 cadmium-translocating P-type ATPase [Campylobacter sp. 7477a]MBE3610447.1 cadmium-translocating P-type ATPase [Campylobacter sp. RM12916]
MSLKTDKICIALSFLLVIFSYFTQEIGVKTALLGVALIIAGYEIIFKAFKSLKNGFSLDENFLMSIASLAAFSIGEMVEAVAILLFYRIGEAFEDYSLNRSRRSVSSLVDLAPKQANLKQNGEITTVDVQSVKVGETIVVRAGEKVPIDGIITSGISLFNTASINGEPLPLELGKGDKITSGFINLNATVEIKTTSEFENSVVSKILDMVENAAFKKSKSEKFITKFARIYTPIVVGFAFVLAFIPPVLFDGDFSEWLKRGIIFIVVSCPCALVVSVPLSFFGGIGGASKNGILIKGSSFIETLSKIKLVAFDKTGTLSKGEFVPYKFSPTNGFSKDELFKFIALAEKNSIHPIAVSIVKAYKEPLDENLIKHVKESAGFGISAVIDGKDVLVGSAKFIKDFNPHDTDETAVHLVVNNSYAGYISLKDELRKESRETIKWLHKNSIKTAMITGDKKAPALAVANELGISSVNYELLPDQKVSVFENFLDKKDKNTSIAYVGDGINDAPVIARADVGVAMLGTDAAIETADVVLMHNNLAKLKTAIQISKKTIGIAKFNIIFSISFKVGVLILAIFGLANIPLAIFADVGVTIIAVLNALRAFKI